MNTRTGRDWYVAALTRTQVTYVLLTPLWIEHVAMSAQLQGARPQTRQGSREKGAEARVSPPVQEFNQGLLLLFQNRHLQIYMGDVDAVSPWSGVNTLNEEKSHPKEMGKLELHTFYSPATQK
jgi:hypothetical protein